MIAPNQEPDQETPEETSRPEMFLLGAAFVPIFYLFLGWVMLRWLGEEPIASRNYRLAVFGLLCAMGLAFCVASFYFLDKGPEKRLRWLHRERLGPVLAIGMVETPAFLGLVYLILYKHTVGFYLLVALSAGAFFAHFIRMQKR